MEGAFRNRADDTYDVARANKFFEQKLLSDSDYAAKLSTRNAEFANKANQEIERIKNSVEETNGTNRPGSTLGDGTSEAALTWEIENGAPYKSTEGHYQKIATYINTIQDAIARLGSFRKYITDPSLLSRIDKAIESGIQRVKSMRPVLDQWNQRTMTHPDVWSPDGKSKAKPNWPSDTSPK